MPREYDIVIVGGGPAGLAAGLYAARSRRRSILLEKGVIGGQISLTELVENYPGVPSVNGFDLAQTMHRQAESHGLETEYLEVKGLEAEGKKWRLLTEGDDFIARALIVTAGADYNRLGVPGEERLTGRGVSYCANCDAAFFRNQEVAVVGGGDSALDEGLFTTRYASKVTVIHRRDELRASRVLQERAFAEPKMNFIWNTVVTEVLGEEQVTGLRTKDVFTGEMSILPVAGVFIFIGHTPNTHILQGLVEMDRANHILVDAWMATNRPGIFAAGDVRKDSARQVATSVGDGVTAAIAADSYISSSFPD